jgi:GT2 family glycosyltransferase
MGDEIVVNNTGHSSLSLSVAILTWNRRESLIKALESVYSQSYKPSEVVVVDSASNDGTLEEIAARFPNVKLIRLHRNMGCPEGRNLSLVNCSGEILYALDDDGWLDSKTLQVCVERFEKDPNIGVVACRILPPGDVPTDSGKDEIQCSFSGGACAIRKEVLEKVGFYPSDFFRQGEEGDLALRVIEAGYKILSCPSAIMFHEPSLTNRNTKLFWYFGVRNELVTIFRQYPWHFVIPAAIQKMISWNYLGLTKSALPYTLGGTVSAIGQLPRLLRTRVPVSPATIRKVLTMKARNRFMRP